MRIFGSDRISGLMQRLGMEEGVPDRARHGHRAIERAQKQVEAQNFAVRKHLLEYDDVMNKQRESVYSLRREILEGKIRTSTEEEMVDTREYLLALAEDLLDEHRRALRRREMDVEELGSRRAQAEVDARLRARRRRLDASISNRQSSRGDYDDARGR